MSLLLLLPAVVVIVSVVDVSDCCKSGAIMGYALGVCRSIRHTCPPSSAPRPHVQCWCALRPALRAAPMCYSFQTSHGRASTLTD